MLGELNNVDIETILYEQIIGRIGCHADNLTYVVPVTYVYDGVYIYAHSSKGMKIDMMRKNADVCFEVDIMQNMANWRSVIAWGKFEELLKDHEKHHAVQIITKRLMPLLTSETSQPSQGITTHTNDAEDPEAIFFRIKLMKKTGRFEKL